MIDIDQPHCKCQLAKLAHFFFGSTVFFDNATQLLWKGHNNKRQDQKENFAIIIIINVACKM